VKAAIEKSLQRLRKSIHEKYFDTFMVLVGENRRYLSGFTGEDTQFDESAGCLFISESSLVLATDSRYELQAANEASRYQIVCYRGGITEKLPDILSTLGTKRLGFESDRMSYRQYRKMAACLKSAALQVELIESENLVENLRVVKDKYEIESIAASLAIAESVFKNVSNQISPGMTEKETAWLIEKGMREAGAEALSFPVIVASGPNSALPHAIPGDRRFKEGEPILFDWGAKLNGYCSDISRTLIIGKPDITFKKIYRTVLEAQRKAIDAIRPGICGKTVDAIARDHIDKMGFKDRFGHGLGHGVGLAIHESPRLSPLKEVALEPGMVFTIEPGIYIPGWGGVRIENMVVVREHGAEVLNRLDAANFMEGAWS
jgi:Xaa-Pro aminopeptidase